MAVSPPCLGFQPVGPTRNSRRRTSEAGTLRSSVTASVTSPPVTALTWPWTVNLLIDLAFVASLIFTITGTATIFAFHMSFALLTLMSVTQSGWNFVLRLVPGLALVIAAVSRAVLNDVLLVDELYEIPILVAMTTFAAWSMQLHRRLVRQLSDQSNRLRRLHAAGQVEYRDQLLLAQRLETFGQLSAGVAHNLRNVLSTILSVAERVVDETDDEAVAAAARRIEEQAGRGGDLITQMLHHARPHQDTASVDLAATVSIEEPSLDILVGPDVELIFDTDEGPLQVQTTRSLMEQMLANLVLNGRDAISGPGRIEVSVRRGKLLGSRPDDITLDAAMLTVTDTGEGMSEEVKSRAFEPFYSTKESRHGAGLGLYTALVIAEDAGGTIQIATSGADGTEIVVTLPLVDVGSPQRRSHHVDLRPEDFFGTEHVLVVDDDQVIQERLCSTLVLYGYDVSEAVTGNEALALLTSGDFDLLVTDVVMPEMDGPELVRQARAQGIEATVLYLSGYDSAAELVPANADLLAKPFSRNMFLTRVRRALDGAPRTEALDS